MIKKDYLSVIVPVYMSEIYLPKCIESIINQTYKKLDIILVDDGSPDDSGRICDKYAQKDNRVRVVHKENSGVSAARNIGISIAEGEYITFVDSDDYLELEMYQKMMKTAHKYCCDVVMCDCLKEQQSGTFLFSHDIRGGYYSYRQLVSEYYPHLLMMENVEFPATISNSTIIFRQEFYDKSYEGDLTKQISENQGETSLRYVEGIRYSEDLLFGAQLMYQARSFYYLKGKAYYHYRIRKDSASHKYDTEAWEDHQRLYNAIKDYFYAVENYDFRHQLDLMILYFVYNTVGETLRENSLSKHEKVEMSKRILRYNNVQEMFKRISIHKIPINWKLKVRTYIYKYLIGLELLVK